MLIIFLYTNFIKNRYNVEFVINFNEVKFNKYIF